ncbi:MAG: hypothetical protein R3349_01145 [Geminicoccaceae bacterium]|nr:hypothetical protein [Geminicoccaceae bacterium]
MSERIRLTRRRLLTETSRLAFLISAAPLIAAEPDVEPQPWFDDGTDWVD